MKVTIVDYGNYLVQTQKQL